VRARSLTVPLPRLLCPVFFDGIRGMIRSDCVGTRLRCANGATGRGFQKLDPKCPVSSSEVRRSPVSRDEAVPSGENCTQPAHCTPRLRSG
jgi:hypothetical protein